MKRRNKIIIALVMATGLGIGAAAYAHPDGAMGPGAMEAGYGPMAGTGQGYGPMGMAGPHGRGGDHAYRGGPDRWDHKAWMQDHLTKFKSDLKITAAQDAAWQAFAAKAFQQAENQSAMRGRMLAVSGSAPERLTQYAEMMKQRVAGMETMAAALKDLYTALTPEQKAIADNEFGMMAHGHHMHG